MKKLLFIGIFLCSVFPFSAFAAVNVSVFPTSGTLITSYTAYSDASTGLADFYLFAPDGSFIARKGGATGPPPPTYTESDGIQWSGGGCPSGPFTDINSCITNHAFGDGVYTLVMTSPQAAPCLNQTLSTCLASNSGAYGSATFTLASTPPPAPSTGGGGLILSIATTSGIIGSGIVGAGSQLAIALGGLLVGVIAIMGLGYAIRHIRNWLTKRRF